jgi:hypothetical protein
MSKLKTECLLYEVNCKNYIKVFYRINFLEDQLRESDEELKRTKERETKLEEEKRKRGKSTFRLRKNCILLKKVLITGILLDISRKI